MIELNRAQKRLKMDSARPITITWLTGVHGAAGSAEEREVINLSYGLTITLLDLFNDQYWA